MRRGFTLIEILAVVLLMALLAAGVVWSFSGMLARSAMNQGIEQIRDLDASARQLARRSGRNVRIIIDSQAGRLTRLNPNGQPAIEFAVPAPLKLAGLRGGSGGDGAGQMVIDVSPMGLSRSYAIELVGGDQRRWIVVAGLNKQVTVRHDDGQTQTILSAMASRRDAD